MPTDGQSSHSYNSTVTTAQREGKGGVLGGRTKNEVEDGKERKKRMKEKGLSKLSIGCVVVRLVGIN